MPDLPPRISLYRDLRKLAEEFARDAKRAEVQARRCGLHSNLRSRFKARELAFRHCEERVVDLASSLDGALPDRAFDPDVAEPGRW